MKFWSFVLVLFVSLLCLSAHPVDEKPYQKPVSTMEAVPQKTNVSSDSDSSPKREDDGWQKVTILGVEMDWNGYTVRESDTDFDPNTYTFDELAPGKFFQTEYPVTRETYRLNEGNVGEVEVMHIHSENPGSTIYVVAGVHGDERAAWYAGIMLRKATIANGDLYIIAPANTAGAARLRRYVTASQDLNRSFPGNPEGNEAEKVAYAIYSDIGRVMPDFVFDLHEAIVYAEGRDFLGSTYIFTELDGIEDLFFDLLWSTEDGTLCHNEFRYTGPGPIGSINRNVTYGLGIPCITVETFRGFDIWRRVYDQLDTVQFTLAYYGMV